MQAESRSGEIAQLEQKIAALTTQLAEAKSAVAQWTEANRSLALSAAEARAQNQGAGRGILGGLLGSKFRGAMRAGAAASNGAIAKEVADTRARIADRKRESQEVVRQVQAVLAAAKQDLKVLTSGTKAKAASKTAVTKAASESLALRQKLKGARDVGLLTEEEYEQKRKKLVSDL